LVYKIILHKVLIGEIDVDMVNKVIDNLISVAHYPDKWQEFKTHYIGGVDFSGMLSSIWKNLTDPNMINAINNIKSGILDVKSKSKGIPQSNIMGSYENYENFTKSLYDDLDPKKKHDIEVLKDKMTKFQALWENRLLFLSNDEKYYNKHFIPWYNDIMMQKALNKDLNINEAKRELSTIDKDIIKRYQKYIIDKKYHEMYKRLEFEKDMGSENMKTVERYLELCKYLKDKK
jgi:hypothetical protein